MLVMWLLFFVTLKGSACFPSEPGDHDISNASAEGAISFTSEPGDHDISNSSARLLQETWRVRETECPLGKYRVKGRDDVCAECVDGEVRRRRAWVCTPCKSGKSGDHGQDDCKTNPAHYILLVLFLCFLCFAVAACNWLSNLSRGSPQVSPDTDPETDQWAAQFAPGSLEAQHAATKIIGHIDTTQDGRADVTLMDTTGDGRADTVIDNGRGMRDGRPNKAIDSSGDGRNDAFLVDSNQDGHYDRIVRAETKGLTVLAAEAESPGMASYRKSAAGQHLYPSYWTSKGDGFVNIQESEYIFKFAHDLLNSTFRSVTTRDRSAAMPEWLEPVKIWRVENAPVFHKYSQYRSQLKAKYENRGPRAAAALNAVDPPPDTYGLLPHNVRDALDSRVAEHYLFHGTSPEGAVGIYRNGFDVRRAGSSAGSLYGAGLYFAECSSKSDEYAVADPAGLYAGHCAMLLCRVTLGSTLYWERESDVARIEEHLDRGGYDSILGDREKLRGTYREFVLPIKSHQGAYPEYIIIYRRQYSKRKPSRSPRPSASGGHSSLRPSRGSSPVPSRGSSPAPRRAASPMPARSSSPVPAGRFGSPLPSRSSAGTYHT